MHIKLEQFPFIGELQTVLLSLLELLYFIYMWTVDMWTIGEHSIIKTTDFPSPRELAEYLHLLNEDDELYNKYFEWKKKGISPQYQRLLNNCIFFAECRVCKKIYEMRDPAAE